MNRSRRHVGYSAVAAAIALLAASCTPSKPPPSPLPPPPMIANAVPLAKTPNFTGPTPPPGSNGTTVKAIAQVGQRLVVGGTFTAVNSVAHKYLASFIAPTGPIDAFAPRLNGEVDAITPNAAGTGYYAAGRFSAVGGFGTRVALFTATGQLVTSFKVSANGQIRSLAVVGTHLLLGGIFSTVGGATRNGLASVNATNGAVDSYLTVDLTGHHNFGRVAGRAESPRRSDQHRGVPRRLADDRRRQLHQRGRPGEATGYARDQIANIILGPELGDGRPELEHQRLHPACFANAYDSYVPRHRRGRRTVRTSSSSLPAANSGARSQDCDAASRFNASFDRAATSQPAWIDYTGTDSIYSVAVTSDAVYIGGHYRWLNNPLRPGQGAAGAVPRPGLAALEPGQRGAAAVEPGASPARPRRRGGLCHGGRHLGRARDTDWIGNYQYKRQKLAFFPFAGGTAAAGDNTGDRAHRVRGRGALATPSRGRTRSTRLPAPAPRRPASRAPAAASPGARPRARSLLNGRHLVRQRRHSSTTAPGTGPTLRPGSNSSIPTTTPTGTTSSTAPRRPARPIGERSRTSTPNSPSVTGMFYANRSIYYTLVQAQHLFSRAFSPDTATSSVAQPGDRRRDQPASGHRRRGGGPVDFSQRRRHVGRQREALARFREHRPALPDPLERLHRHG